MLKKLGRKALRHDVYDQLLQAIVSGEFEAGEHLDEKELADNFGISRTPLREAINRLVHDGLILEIPFKGSFVRKFTPQEVNDIYEVRKTLEVLAICMAVRNMSEDELNEITAIVNKIAAAQESGYLLAYSELDTAFHEKLALFSRNKTLVRMLESLGIQIRVIRHMANKNKEVVSRSQFERVRILEALQQRNEAKAAAFMEEHIDNIRRDVVSILNNSSK